MNSRQDWLRWPLPGVLPEAGGVWSWQPCWQFTETQGKHCCPVLRSDIALHCVLLLTVSSPSVYVLVPAQVLTPCLAPREELAVTFWNVTSLVSTCGRAQGRYSWAHGDCSRRAWSE